MMMDQNKKFLTGDGRVVGIQYILDTYRDVFSELRPSSGKIKPILGSNNYILSSNYETLDCDQLEILRCSKAHLLTIGGQGGKNSIRTQPLVETNSSVDIASAHSRTGNYLARIKDNAKGVDKKQILEIWNRSRLIKSIDTSLIEAHGAINTDPVFSSFSWSKFDEKKLLYVCERKKPKQRTYFKQEHASSKDSDDLGLKHSCSEDWGECLTGIEHTIVAVLDVSDGCAITTLDMEGYSLGDSQWINDQRTVTVAYPEEPRRLGLIYCNSRPSILVVHDWSCSPPKELQRIQDNRLSFTTPRVFEKSERFVYLAAPTYGPHYHAQMLYLSDAATPDKTLDSGLLVDSQFIGGTNTVSLPKDCFLCGDRYIIFLRDTYTLGLPTGISSCQQLCLYDLDKSKIIDTSFLSQGIQILDIRDDLVFAAGSDINICPSLYVGKVYPTTYGHDIEWHGIDVPRIVKEVCFEPFEIPTSDGSFVSGFLITPDLEELHRNIIGQSLHSPESDDSSVDQNDLPTVVLVHGGPHSAFKRTYMPFLIVNAKLGLRTLLINYRGSSGVSEEYLNSLCGRVGDSDVKDCLLAIRHFVQNGVINPDKLIIQGGSHGGFLAAHLSCQREFKFTSAIIRNPVIDLSTMHLTTDIPDWCYNEGLGHKTYDPTWLPNGRELERMFECSPLSKFHDAFVPTLMLLGNQDKRVPMFQGQRWYQLLKARGVKTQCKVYDDKHDLAKPESATDGNITAITWILTNLETSSSPSSARLVRD